MTEEEAEKVVEMLDMLTEQARLKRIRICSRLGRFFADEDGNPGEVDILSGGVTYFDNDEQDWISVPVLALCINAEEIYRTTGETPLEALDLIYNWAWTHLVFTRLLPHTARA
jgi:hypothetical protein